LYYWTGIGILTFVSCNPVDRKQDITFPIVCHTGDIPKVEKKVLLSELTDDVDIVRLETNDSCLIKRTTQVYITDNYIGTPDGKTDLSFKLFDRKGHYVAQIGSKGQGPHEYLGLYCASIDEAAGRIYLAEFVNADKLLCYDLAGKHIENIPFYFKRLSKPQFFIKNDTVTVVSMPFRSQEMLLFQQNMKGELIRFVPPPADFDLDKTEYYDEELFLTRNKGVFSFHYTGIDTLYGYDAKSNRLVPQFSLQMDGKKMRFPVYFEWPDHFFFIDWVTKTKILVDKHTGNAQYVKIINDFLGGLEVEYLMCNNDYAVIICEAFKLRQDLEKALEKPGLSQEVRDRMIELVDSIDDDDNPVLVIGKLKQ
jgi:hypothetical protein